MSESNNRLKEEAIIMNQLTYLIQGLCVDFLLLYIAIFTLVVFELDDPTSIPKLEGIFVFLTACAEVPPLGFPNCHPKMSQFLLHQHVLCLFLLTLFHLKRKKKDFTILNSQVFGQV